MHPGTRCCFRCPTAADNPVTSLAFRLTINNNSSGTIQLDNFQVQAIAQTVVSPQVTSLTGNTICSGAAGQLTMSVNGGTAPYTVIYNDGTANRTATGVASGIAFNTFTNPAVTTNYTLVSVTDANGLVRSSGFTDGAATITVNPTPTVNSVSNQSICNNGTTTAINFTGAVSGTTYNWVSTGIAASGTGNIPAVTIPNSGTVPIVATVTVTPTTNGCTGTPAIFTITVNPTLR